MSDTEDRLAVIEACTRMAWHADRREWDQLAVVFTDAVTLDYTSLNGGEPATLSPKQLVAGWSALLGAFDATQHLITNHLVRLDGDAAVCTAAFQATHRLANPAVLAWPEWLSFDPIAAASTITTPTLLVHSEGGAIPDGARRFHKELAGPKEMVWTEGTQFDFYDREPTVTTAVDAAADFFAANL